MVSAVNGCGSAQHVPQPHDRQQAVAQPINFGVERLLDAAAHPGMQTDGFFQFPLWDGIPLAVHGDDQAGNDRQRQRHPQDHRGPESGLRVDHQRSFEELDVRLDHVHADSAAGHLGHLPGGREAGKQDQGQQFSRRHPVELGFGLQPHGQRLGPHGLGIDAPPIVANLDANLAIFMCGREGDLPGRGLAFRDPFRGSLDAVVDTVADQMSERIRQLLEDRLVELDLPADDRHLDLFAELPSEVTNHPREFPEQVADRLHPGPQNRLLKRGSDRVESLHDGPERTVILFESQQRIDSGSASVRRSASSAGRATRR